MYRYTMWWHTNAKDRPIITLPEWNQYTAHLLRLVCRSVIPRLCESRSLSHRLKRCNSIYLPFTNVTVDTVCVCMFYCHSSSICSHLKALLWILRYCFFSQMINECQICCIVNIRNFAKHLFSKNLKFEFSILQLFPHTWTIWYKKCKSISGFNTINWTSNQPSSYNFTILFILMKNNLFSHDVSNYISLKEVDQLCFNNKTVEILHSIIT